MDQRHHFTDSSLRELRLVVEASRDMSEDSMVRVRTRFSSNGDGSLVRRVLIVAPEGAAALAPDQPDQPDQPGTSDLFAPRGD